MLGNLAIALTCFYGGFLTASLMAAAKEETAEAPVIAPGASLNGRHGMWAGFIVTVCVFGLWWVLS